MAAAVLRSGVRRTGAAGACDPRGRHGRRGAGSGGTARKRARGSGVCARAGKADMVWAVAVEDGKRRKKKMTSGTRSSFREES